MEPTQNTQQQENVNDTPVVQPQPNPQISQSDIPTQQVQPTLPLQSSPSVLSKPKSIVPFIFGSILILALISGTFFLITAKKTKTESFNQKQNPPSISKFVTPEPTVDSCETPLAPNGATRYTKCHFRKVKISVPEAQSVQSRIGDRIGSINIPQNIKFSHQEVYKGITIEWTEGQPLSDNTLLWLKSGIDILPDYFIKDHPVTAIISATDEELGSQTLFRTSVATAAYASGLNIFISNTVAKGGSDLYPVNKENVIQTLFHEWVHVVQHYEVLQNYAEEYLTEGNLSVDMKQLPIIKNYANAAGWIFNNDAAGEEIFGSLGQSSDAQKISDYGKTKFIEDMAESGSYFMLCQNDKISEARIKWWESTTGTTRNTYCPPKI